MGKIFARAVALAALAPVSFAQGGDPVEQALTSAVQAYSSEPPPLPPTAATRFGLALGRLVLVLDTYFPSPTPAELELAFRGIGKGMKGILKADLLAGGDAVNLSPLDSILSACAQAAQARLDQYGNEYGMDAPAFLKASASLALADAYENAGDRVRALKSLTKALRAVRAAGTVNPSSPPPGPTPIPGISYPIVFVDGPRNGTPPGPPSLGIGAVEFPEIEGFAPNAAIRTRETRLKMIRPDGTVETLYGSGNGAVLHPSVSFDGTKIYFAYDPDVGDDGGRFDVYRMDWTIPGRPVTNLTAPYTEFAIFDAGVGPNGVTAADLAAAANLASGVVRRPSKLHFWNPFEYLDPQGRVKVMAVSTYGAERMPKVGQGVGDLVVMDLDGSNLRTFLHVPGGAYFAFQAPNGRLYWGEWAQELTRNPANNFFVALCEQDGTAHQQFDRFHVGFFDIAAPVRNSLSPSSNGLDIVGVVYYAGNNLGWGALQAVPDRLPGIEFSTNDAVGDPVLHAPIVRLGRRFVTAGPQRQDPDGPQAMKFRDPTPAEGEQMLVAYTPGPASLKMPVGSPPPWERWNAGIYLCPQGAKETIASPAQLVRIYDNPSTNSFMPRQVAPYAALFGVPAPALQAGPNRNDGAQGLPKGSPYAIARGSTLIGETATAPNPYALPHLLYWNGQPQPNLWNWFYTFFDGEWPLPKRYQGYENGAYVEPDLAYVRVLARKRIPATAPFLYTGVGPYDPNTTFGAVWAILGEFDVRAGKSSPYDLSYKVKIPADTPVMFQALDRYGMAITSETFARETKPGSRMTCAGCHARGIAGVDFAATEAASPGFPLHDAVSSHGIAVPNFQGGSASATPLLSSSPQTWYFEDVKPIFGSCVGCHTSDAPGGAAAELDLRDQVVNGKTLYDRLARDYAGVSSNPEGYDPVYTGGWRLPNVSRFVKAGSARESLLLWKLVGPLVGNASKRLDGRLNSDFPTEEPPGTLSLGPPPNHLVDVDNRDAGCAAHTFVQNGTISNEMVAKLARWIDLGCPQRYLSPNLPAYKAPDLDFDPPSAGIYVDLGTSPPTIHLGAWDGTGLDPSSAWMGITPTGVLFPLSVVVPGLTAAAFEAGISFPSPVPLGPGQTVFFTVKDLAGNIRRVVCEP
ncbi:MAG TPA: hypothetical protein VFI25_04520 [Planctomycetota bacterium]|jgi:hypothetical protein|nr:hypothetical protein [Planctomycetota bacterium]